MITLQKYGTWNKVAISKKFNHKSDFSLFIVHLYQLFKIFTHREDSFVTMNVKCHYFNRIFLILSTSAYILILFKPVCLYSLRMWNSRVRINRAYIAIGTVYRICLQVLFKVPHTLEDLKRSEKDFVVKI